MFRGILLLITLMFAHFANGQERYFKIFYSSGDFNTRSIDSGRYKNTGGLWLIGGGYYQHLSKSVFIGIELGYSGRNFVPSVGFNNNRPIKMANTDVGINAGYATAVNKLFSLYIQVQFISSILVIGRKEYLTNNTRLFPDMSNSAAIYGGLNIKLKNNVGLFAACKLRIYQGFDGYFRSYINTENIKPYSLGAVFGIIAYL